eukprot:6490527-Amphidinium_carterae.1
MEDKIKIIEKVYFDTAGYGSITETLKDAKKYDKSITYDDVKKWKASQEFSQKTKMRGTNSFIAQKPQEEYQMDLLFFTDDRGSNQPALLMVDIFSKYTQAVKLKSKQIGDVLAGIMECINKMGGKPETIYSDAEGAFMSNIVKEYFVKHNIRHLTTLGHAPVAERQIRTIKSMIDKRSEQTNEKWDELLDKVLLVYNRKKIHTVTGMTPVDAMKEENQSKVKINLELKKKHSRKYPNIAVGDYVRVFKKKDKLDKERVSNWSADKFEVVEISESMNQTFYKVKGKDKFLMRSEVLLVD